MTAVRHSAQIDQGERIAAHLPSHPEGEGPARSLTLALDPSPADRVDAELLAAADFVVPNPPEAERLVGVAVEGVEDAFRAAERLREAGVGTALVKLGDGGCVVVGEKVHEHVRSAKCEAVDTTGAGDAFAGALAVALLEGSSARDAARWAVAAADVAVTGWGSQPSYPGRGELERRLARAGRQPASSPGRA
jgi:ribokinase